MFPHVIPAHTVMHETELVGLFLRRPTKIEKRKKKVIVHVCVEFCDKAVIRPRLLGRVGCLQKRSSIKVCFPCSVKG